MAVGDAVEVGGGYPDIVLCLQKWFDGGSRAEKLVRIVSLCHGRPEVLCIYNPGYSFRYRGSSCNFPKKNR